MTKQMATGWEKSSRTYMYICLLPTSCVPARDNLQECATFNGTFGTRLAQAKQGVLETAMPIFEKRKLANI